MGGATYLSRSPFVDCLPAALAFLHSGSLEWHFLGSLSRGSTPAPMMSFAVLGRCFRFCRLSSRRLSSAFAARIFRNSSCRSLAVSWLTRGRSAGRKPPSGDLPMAPPVRVGRGDFFAPPSKIGRPEIHPSSIKNSSRTLGCFADSSAAAREGVRLRQQTSATKNRQFISSPKTD